MKLLGLQLSCPGSLGDLQLAFVDEAKKPLPVALLYGGPGAGKTTVLSAIAQTRPGNTLAMGVRPSEPACFVRSEWWVGLDEPDRQRALVLCSPNAPPEFTQLDLEARREVAFFDRFAREGGFAFLCFSALRWFSKVPVLLTAPDRTVRRYDVRANDPLDDAARHDLTRDVKQALAYAEIVRALPEQGDERFRPMGEAMLRVVNELSSVLGFRYLGLDPASLEPIFQAHDGTPLAFDRLPNSAKHATAFGALTLRTLWSAYPGLNPALAQGVVAIDQLELHQDIPTACRLLDVLATTLPDVQWLITTRSAELLAARAPEERFALRRLHERAQITVHTGRDANVH